MEESSYFGIMKSRRSNIIRQDIIWNELDENIKEQEALRRMKDHNRLKNIYNPMRKIVSCCVE